MAVVDDESITEIHVLLNCSGDKHWPLSRSTDVTQYFMFTAASTNLLVNN